MPLLFDSTKKPSLLTSLDFPFIFEIMQIGNLSLDLCDQKCITQPYTYKVTMQSNQKYLSNLSQENIAKASLLSIFSKSFDQLLAIYFKYTFK